jgi:hypothetical protein
LLGVDDSSATAAAVNATKPTTARLETDFIERLLVSDSVLMPGLLARSVPPRKIARIALKSMKFSRDGAVARRVRVSEIR